VKKFLFAGALLTTPALCMAQTINDPLVVMIGALNAFSTSTFGNVLVITVMMVGMALAVFKNNFVPMMTAVSLAVFVHLAPGILQNITGIEVPSDTSTSVVSALEQPALPVEAQHAASEAPQPARQVARPAAEPTVPDTQLSTQTPSEISSIVSHVEALGPTVPVPQGEHHEAMPVKQTSFWNVTTELGVAGALIILVLLGLMAYGTRPRTPAKDLGFIPSRSTGTAPSAFTDPHGFVRSKSNP
jgi:hypothetical protein